MAKKTIIGTCNLCFENKELIKGHILPDWSSRLSGKAAIYDFVLTGETPAPVIVGNVPQGPVAEYLFCEECDNEFGRGEYLLREMVHPSNNKPSCIAPVKDFGIELKGKLAINQFYCGIGGLLLKAHLSKDEMWGDFILNKKQRNLIFNGLRTSCLSQYLKVVIYKIYSLEHYKIGNFTDKFTDLDQLIPFSLHYKLKPGIMQHGNFVTMFVFGGLILVVDVHPKGIINSSFPAESRIIPTAATDMRYLLDSINGYSLQNFKKYMDISKIRAYKEMLRKTPLESSCPCKVYFTNEDGIKVNRKFGDCCHKYWGFD